jgi:hypothetical protein
MMGRKDTENPAKEESVLSYREGYRNDLHDRGVCEKRAKVMKEGKVINLVEYLGREIEKAEKIGKVILLMDRAAVLYVWESWARGKECGELEARQIDREDAVSLPGWSKLSERSRAGELVLPETKNG